jgi:bacterioferritin-associated ferredoxin
VPAVIVCQCRRVSDRKVAASVRKGCSSLRDVCAATGAGRECGCCVRRLKELIEEHLAPTSERQIAHATA